MTSRYANYDDTPWFFWFSLQLLCKKPHSPIRHTVDERAGFQRWSTERGSCIPNFRGSCAFFFGKKNLTPEGEFWKVPNQHWLQKSTDTQQSHTWNTWNMMQPDQQPARKNFPKAAFVSASCSSGQCDVVLFPPTGPGISPSLWALENTTQAEVKPTETSTEEDSRLSLKSKTKFHDEKKKHDFKSFQHLVKSKVVQQFSPVFFGDKRSETKRFCPKKWLSATEARNAEYLSSSMSASLGRCECHRSQASQQRRLQSFTPRIFVLKNGGKIEKNKNKKTETSADFTISPHGFQKKTLEISWKISSRVGMHPNTAGFLSCRQE